MIEFLTNLTAPWAQMYSDHSWIGIVVVYLHLVGILWGAGRAVTADRQVLRTADQEEFAADGALEFLRESHRQVLFGLGVIVVSGVLMFASEVEHYLTNPVYLAKMGLFVALLINGAFFQRLEGVVDQGGPAAEKAWRRIRLHSMLSIGLWMVVMLLGVALVSA